MTQFYTILTWVEYLGTIAFAVSGAIVGIKKHMDIFGVAILGLVTACGGGLIRDIVLNVMPAAVFRNPIFATIAITFSGFLLEWKYCLTLFLSTFALPT